MSVPARKATNKSNAKYYYLQALRYGDIKSAAKYLKVYFDKGGTKDPLRSRLKLGMPLAGIPINKRGDFWASLDDKEKETFETAKNWHYKTYGEAAKRRLSDEFILEMDKKLPAQSTRGQPEWAGETTSMISPKPGPFDDILRGVQ